VFWYLFRCYDLRALHDSLRVEKSHYIYKSGLFPNNAPAIEYWEIQIILRHNRWSTGGIWNHCGLDLRVIARVAVY